MSISTLRPLPLPAPAKTLAQQVRQLQADARDLASDHVAALIRALGDVERLAADVPGFGDLVPVGVREIAVRLAEEAGKHGLTLQALQGPPAVSLTEQQELDMNPQRAVQTSEESRVVAASPDTIMAVIARAASDPNTDVDKLERLMAMAERLSARQAETAFNEAMNAAQTEMRAIAKDASGDKGKYASFVALDKAARPIYSAQGFSLSFDTGDGAPADHVRLLCYVSHREGHTRTYHADMPADGKGAKGNDVMTKTHATGAAMTYGQRYLFRLIFNLAVGEDNDGNGREASNEELDFIVEINDAANAADLAAWKARTGEAASQYPRVVSAYNDRAKRLKAAKAEASDFPGDRR